MSIELFRQSIKSQQTRRCYDYYLKKYGEDKLSIADPKIVEDNHMRYERHFTYPHFSQLAWE